MAERRIVADLRKQQIPPLRCAPVAMTSYAGLRSRDDVACVGNVRDDGSILGAKVELKILKFANRCRGCEASR
jgi:hypothetical protein